MLSGKCCGGDVEWNMLFELGMLRWVGHVVLGKTCRVGPEMLSAVGHIELDEMCRAGWEMLPGVRHAW